jgi:hypothetical protein
MIRRTLVLAATLAGLLFLAAPALAVNVVRGPAVPPEPGTVPPNTMMIGGPAAKPSTQVHTPAPPKDVGPIPERQRFGIAAPPHSRQHRNATNYPMTYHGGPTMTYDTNYAIFWEPPHLQNGAGTGVASNFNYMMYRYFTDIGGSGIYNINTQYYYTSYGYRYNIANSSKWGGYIVDTSPYPPGGCYNSYTGYNCVSDNQIQNEVRKVLSQAGLTPTLYNEFFVYTAANEGTCFSSNQCYPGQFCAYHSKGVYGSRYFIYANMPYGGNNCLARAPGGQVLAPNGNGPIDAEINVTSHEQMESVTDPYLNAWMGPGGVSDENGDKCAYSYGSRPYLGGAANQYMNGHYYIMQMEWNNYRGGCTRYGP